MSDYEGGPAAEDDLSLPRATVYKLIAEMLPDDVACAKDTRDLLLDCCNEFIHLIASESNEICEKEAKKTIAAEHVLAALRELGFEKYVTEVKEAYSEHRQQQIKDRGRKSTKLNQLGMSEEELQRSQELLFAQARMRLQNQTIQDPPSANGSATANGGNGDAGAM
ncbi:negative cofactor 2 transcription regulator complex subunit ncb2 [Coemansia sp. IMI 203386]|nr:negative cofactor 2 transcription regulator complex subunit ncb2 [Coemansia sp. RSA 485]KAJ2706728.1 negative cofactor 2 transcription regulator complex subunit ncb2 [Coemansia sp. IMI 203386]